MKFQALCQAMLMMLDRVPQSRLSRSLGLRPVREQRDAEPWRSFAETLDLLRRRRAHDFVRFKFVAAFLNKVVEESRGPD